MYYVSRNLERDGLLIAHFANPPSTRTIRTVSGNEFAISAAVTADTLYVLSSNMKDAYLHIAHVADGQIRHMHVRVPSFQVPVEL